MEMIVSYLPISFRKPWNPSFFRPFPNYTRFYSRHATVCHIWEFQLSNYVRIAQWMCNHHGKFPEDIVFSHE